MRFVTNSTKESTGTLHARLLAMGFDIKREELFTSLSAAVRLVQSAKLNPMLFLEEDALGDFSHNVDQKNAEKNAVVVGLAPSKFTHENLSQAMRILLDHDALIAIHKGRYYAKSDGLYIGPGAFVEGLEYSTGRKARVVGKPNADFFKQAINGLGCDAVDVLFAGDDVVDDVGGALNVGMAAYLVRTGKYTPKDEEVNIRPNGIYDTVADLIDDVIKSI